ncbi:MAG: L-rhamnose mutarotase [Phycisphaerales bacterium]
MMQHVCVLFHVKKDKIQEYRQAHQVWPRMLQAITRAGIRNYSLFIRPDGLVVGYFEAENPTEARHQLAQSEINQRWQKYMAEYLEVDSDDEQQVTVEYMENYFHLD